MGQPITMYDCDSQWFIVVARENKLFLVKNMADKKQYEVVMSDAKEREVVAQVVAQNRESCATTFDAILDRMKLVVGAKSDTAFAKAMGLNQSSVSGAKERQSIPPAWAIQLAEKFDISIDWIWFGKGRMKPEGGAMFRPAKLPNPYMVGHQVEGRDQQAEVRDVVPQQSVNIDRDRITMAIQAVEEGLKVTNRELPPDKKASLILAAYDLIEESGNAAKIVELIRIVA
jgi:hypothetical protein